MDALAHGSLTPAGKRHDKGSPAFEWARSREGWQISGAVLEMAQSLTEQNTAEWLYWLERENA